MGIQEDLLEQALDERDEARRKLEEAIRHILASWWDDDDDRNAQDLRFVPRMSAQHSTASNEHYTPPEYIEAAREVMGGLDLDPASAAPVNEALVKATAFYSKEDDGLTKPWHGRIWLNPPGGRIGNRSSAAVWWGKLVEEWHAGRVTQAVFLGFSVEILATTQDAGIWTGAAPFCVPKRRIQFLGPGFVRGESPTHSNVICYLPPELPAFEPTRKFARVFGKFGRVRV